jgi:hypothetical protein
MPVFSPNSQRVAYLALFNERALVVVDGEEREQQEAIAAGTFTFTPDSRHLVYIAKIDNQRSVVIDGEMGKQYEGIITRYGGKLIFDAPDKLRYLALDGSKVYIVEETISIPAGSQ